MSNLILDSKDSDPHLPAMTFYHAEVLRIRENELPKSYLVDQVMQAKQYIDVNFADSLDLDRISGAGCCSKFHFIRIFKKIYGRTPHQYLISVRIEKARQLLKVQKSVTEACFAVGFDSVSSFTGLFKKMVGVTPSAFKNRNCKLG